MRDGRFDGSGQLKCICGTIGECFPFTDYAYYVNIWLEDNTVEQHYILLRHISLEEIESIKFEQHFFQMCEIFGDQWAVFDYV